MVIVVRSEKASEITFTYTIFYKKTSTIHFGGFGFDAKGASSKRGINVKRGSQ